jgi:glycosyltransferase involved in cell wall biosynthesis
MNPLISVIIPAHNNERTIEVAIRSILLQTWNNLEIIVVDDNSTDGTKTIVERLAKQDKRLFYYALPFNDPERVNKRGRNINAGYSARNFGFDKSKGKYITFQDADDASFLNRIEVQFELLKKHKASHVTLDWQKFDEKKIGKSFNANAFMNDFPGILQPEEIANIASRAKGIVIKTFGSFHSKIDFEWKRARFVHKLFFGSLEQYPGTGNSPLFTREVMEKIKFRKLSERVWPSFMGRGADRDFNFQAAETFRNSYVFFIPMYLWRQDNENTRYNDIEKYIIPS